MISIDPNTLYTRADLRALLQPAGVHVDNFIARIRPRKPFHKLYWGAHIIEAINKVEAAAEAEAPEPTVWPAGPKRSGPGRVVVMKGKGE